jgi:plastocyanin
MKSCTPIFLTLAILLSGVTVQAGEINGTVKVGRNNSNAAVYIDAIKGKTFTTPSEKPKMDQKQMTFIPHVLPILLGTTVEFHNSDTVLHNVFTPSKAGDRFNLGTWPAGIVKTYTFKKPGIVALLCNVHPEMSAYIIVVETPFFDVTDKEGKFSIKNVPAGTYTLVAWHERLRKNLSKPVTVPEKGSVQVDFSK